MPDRWEFKRELGNRRHVMILLAVLGICHGLLLRNDPFPEDGWLFYYGLPVWLRITLWVDIGVLAIFFALFTPCSKERVGWYALLVMPLQRFIGHLGAAVVYLVPGGRFGSKDSLVYAVLWGTATMVVWRISRWRELKFEGDDE